MNPDGTMDWFGANTNQEEDDDDESDED